MSQIDKLLIRGIRSFDPNGTNIIEFYTPLTIIVGHNGAGKTTVIECLKYATTGDLPPNSRSGAFIHDPKLAHETEVKAQIKLLFKNVNGRQMVCTRSMSLTQKKTTMQQKTLESLLLIKDPETGESHSLSTKCAELDAELPLQLGVSKPILDNVIFCHQEESFWPLSEPSVLKKKFDEIFASTRYTKALDSIKVLRKEQAIKLKLAQNNLDHLKSNKGKAERVRETLTTIEGKLTVAQERIQILDGGEIERLTTQMRDIVDQDRKVQALKNRIDQANLQKNMVMKTIAELKSNLVEEYQESDEGLREILRQYEENVRSSALEEEGLKREKESADQEVRRLAAEDSQLRSLHGQLKAERDAHERRIQEREAVIMEISAEHNYSGFNVRPLSSDDINRFTQRLRADIEDKTAGMDSLKMEVKEHENAILAEIQRLKADITSVEETKKMTRRQMDNHRQKISQYMQQMHNIKVTEADIDDLQRRLKEEELALDESRRGWTSADFDLKLRKLNQELQDYEYELTKVNDEMALLNMQADIRARLSLKKAEKERKQETLSRTMTSVKEEFESSLGHVPTAANMEREVDGLYRMKLKSVKQLEEQLERKNRELSAVDTKVMMARTNLNKKTAELDDKSAQIKSATGSDDFATALTKLESEVDEKRDELSSMKSAGSMYTKFIKKFEDNGCCPLCSRGFDGADGREFLSKLQTILTRVPEATQILRNEVAAAERKRDVLRNLRSVWDDAERLKNLEIPEIKRKLQEYENEKSKISSEAEDITSELAIISVEKQNAELLRQKAEEIVRLHRDLEQIEQDINRINRELSSSGSTKTMDEVQREHEELQAKCRDVRRDIERANNEGRAKQRELQTRENRLRDVREQLQQSRFQFQERDKLQIAIADLKSEIEQLQRDMESAESKASEVGPVLREKEAELTRYRQRMGIKEADYMRSLNSLQQSMNRLRSIEKEIQGYIERGVQRRLQQCENDQATVAVQMAEAKERGETVTHKLQDISNNRACINNLRREIDDNLRYRELQREQVSLEERIKALTDEHATYDKASISTQYEKLKKKHEHLVGERAGLVGESKQMQEQARRLERELRTDYKDIEEEYRKQLIELKTEEMANHDLEKYAKALDNAIMKYHSMKMEEINKIIRELWVNTYQGSDIDTIEIRSDNENVKGNRTYNYRVVMVKGDIALDMRGRCSAGQKVLTSLIIRLALAETFCLNCGILALDEPTTNLDKDNVESLAESLANIIKLRRQQSNFQLIIITHDEEFMHLLGKSEYADYYWRVSKDEEGHSMITRHAVQDS